MPSDSLNRKAVALKKLTNGLVRGALTTIRMERPNSSAQSEDRFRTAEYFLLESKEYIDASWEMLACGKWKAALALSRWVLEAVINLRWATASKGETGQRLRDLCGEALRNEANRYDGCAELWPDKAQVCRAKAEKARAMRRDLGAKELKGSLEARINSTRPTGRPDWSNLYALYRICCFAAHPDLRVCARFREKAGGATVSAEPPDDTAVAFWVAAASTLWLVHQVYHLTGVRNAPDIEEWWRSRIRPLVSHG